MVVGSEAPETGGQTIHTEYDDYGSDDVTHVMMTRVHGCPGNPNDVDRQQNASATRTAVSHLRHQDTSRPGDVSRRKRGERNRISGEDSSEERDADKLIESGEGTSFSRLDVERRGSSSWVQSMVGGQVDSDPGGCGREDEPDGVVEPHRPSE